jgi:hypothetical protein
MEVESIEPSPSVSRVPGSPFGMALVRSQIVPVLRLGESNTCLIVGRVHGELFGIVGLQVVGFQAEEPPGVRWSACVDVELNVGLLLAEMKLRPAPQIS